MPHPRPWDFTCQKHVFLNCPEDSRSQNRSISQLQALRADSFLMDKLNPFWETELSYRCPKPSSKRPPGGGLRQSQEEWRRVAGLGRRQRTGNELLPFGQFPRAVPSSQTDWDAHSCLPGGASMCVSSPKLQLERTVVQKWKQDYESLFSFSSAQTK